MSLKRKVLVAVAVGLMAGGGGVAVASADGEEPPDVENPIERADLLPDEVQIVDQNGAIVRNPDGTPKMHSTELPPLLDPTEPDVTYPDPPGTQTFNDVEAPLVADQGDWLAPSGGAIVLWMLVAAIVIGLPVVWIVAVIGGLRDEVAGLRRDLAKLRKDTVKGEPQG